MFRSLRQLEGFGVRAVDGDIGRVLDTLFDDERWVMRYLVVRAGSLLSGRHVLITPLAFRDVDWSDERFELRLDREMVESSPGVDTNRPVSRQHERAYFLYYGYPFYWAYDGIWGPGGTPPLIAPGQTFEQAAEPEEDGGDSHLRSSSEVRGYHLQGSDDAIGHVADFLVDENTWRIHYLVVDTRNWWLGHHVLVPPQWASFVSWDERRVHVSLSREQIETAPAWDVREPVTRELEQRLFAHYGRAPYWSERREVSDRSAPSLH